MLEARLGHLVLERGEQRVKFLLLPQTGQLAGGEERVDALDERLLPQLMVLEEEHTGDSLHACLRKDHFQLIAE